MSSWINEVNYSGKPNITWIEPYLKKDSSFVRGHFRTSSNETIADKYRTYDYKRAKASAVYLEPIRIFTDEN